MMKIKVRRKPGSKSRPVFKLDADLRGEDVLPELLQVINSAPVTDPALAPTVQELSSWAASDAYLHPPSATSNGKRL